MELNFGIDAAIEACKLTLQILTESVPEGSWEEDRFQKSLKAVDAMTIMLEKLTEMQKISVSDIDPTFKKCAVGLLVEEYENQEKIVKQCLYEIN